MKPEILTKLKASLQEKFTGAQVVYILAQIRKIIELEGSKEQYEYLRFFTDWTVHSKLDTGKLAIKVLKQFKEHHEASNEWVEHFEEDFAEARRHEGQPYDPFTNERFRKHVESTTKLSEIWSGRNFQADLEKFLASHDLDTELCTGRWHEFMDAYSSVIEDAPLEFKSPIEGIASIRVSKSSGDIAFEGAAATAVSAPFQYDRMLELTWIATTVDGKHFLYYWRIPKPA